MARKTTKSTTPTGTAKTRRRRNVRAVTIDLEATEVGEETGQDDEPGPDPVAAADPQSENPTPPEDTDTGAADMGESVAGPDPKKIGNVPVVAYLKYGAAGLAGGLLALLIYSGLARFGLAPFPAGGDATELAGSVDQLRQSLSRQETDQATRLGEIETRLSGFTSNGPDPELAARLDKLESTTAGLDSKLAAIDISTLQRLTDNQDNLESRVAALTERLDAVAATDETGPRLAGFEARLGVLETNTETLLADLQAAASGGDGAGIAGADLLALRQSLTSLLASAKETKAQLTARMDGLENIIQAAGAAAATLAARADDIQSTLGERVDGLETRISEFPTVQFTGTGAGAEARAAASLAFAALERAVREGRPYSAELDLLAGITSSIPGDIMTALAPTAGDGVATLADLTKQFEAIATKIIEAEAGAGDAGFLDQTLTRIRSVVRIRPTGFVEGDSVAAIVARTEAYLNAGELKPALDELVALEGPAGEAAAGWFGAANTRLNTGEALDALNRFLLGNARPANAPESQ